MEKISNERQIQSNRKSIHLSITREEFCFVIHEKILLNRQEKSFVKLWTIAPNAAAAAEVHPLYQPASPPTL